MVMGRTKHPRGGGGDSQIEEETLAVSSTTPTLCTSEIKRRRSGSTPVCSLSAPGPLHLPPNLVSVGNWNDPGGHQLIEASQAAGGLEDLMPYMSLTLLHPG